MADRKGERLAEEIERRQHFRVQADLDAPFSVERTGEEGLAHVANLGMGGARIDLPVEVQLPGQITLLLPPLGSMPDLALEITGQLSWTVTDKPGGPYPTGLQFTGLEPELKRRLFKYMAFLLE